MNNFEHHVPIVHIDQNLYLMGVKVKQFNFLNDVVQVRVGGGWEELEQHLHFNYRTMQ